MTGEKVLQVIDLYEARLNTGVRSFDPRVQHLREMIPKMREFVTTERMDKAFRWLGFIQGVLWILGLYTLDELKDHNRSGDTDG